MFRRTRPWSETPGIRSGSRGARSRVPTPIGSTFRTRSPTRSRPSRSAWRGSRRGSPSSTARPPRARSRSFGPSRARRRPADNLPSMGERTSYPAGTFSWADLATTDSEGAKAFYGGVFGWELEEMPVPEGPPYVMARIDGKSVAALYERGADVPGPPAWLSYVTVDDADATAARAGELGATTISEPFDVVDAGRMAVLQDPTGAMFAVWQARTSIGAELVNDPGAMKMNQHNTGGPAAAQAFYEGLFGWGFETVAEGDQPFWSIYNGGRLHTRGGGARPGG